MAYVALYRRFRPKTFDEVVGQEHIVKTLKNQIENDRIGHAYLFSGGRGSGKTSTAKILARAVNCEHPIHGEPCNECEMCKQALEGSLVDITEMDAASNNGVDNIRDIREEVEFIPTAAKYRVYIIDEVHMLSTGAFNALLKTLEEPPAHVIFILATTEPQKLPMTILSRCQRFDFKRLSIENIMKRLRVICSETNTSIQENALRLIAVLADGAMRDAISILDRCIAEGEGEITEQKVRELAGIPEFEYLTSMAEALITSDVDKVLEMSEKLIADGKDLNVFLWELIKLMRDLLILSTCKEIDVYQEVEKEKLQLLLQETNKGRLITLIDGLSSLSNAMKWATEQNIIWETGMIKLCTKLENSAITEDHAPMDLKTKVLTKLKENGKILLHTKLEETRIELGEEDGLVHIIFDKPVDSFVKMNLLKEESKLAIKEAVISAVGKEISVKFVNLKGKDE